MIDKEAMIKIDFTAKLTENVNPEDSQKIFDTTIEEIAKSENIYKKHKSYEPMLVVLGKNWIPLGLEEQIAEAKVGDDLTTLIEAKDAYGPKDPSKIKLVARREFQKININPSIGQRVTIGSQTGTVLSVTSSRVRMDYNHVLAGKDIEYTIKIHEEIKGDENKIKELIKRRIPGANLDTMEVNIEKEKVIVNIPEEARFYEFIQFAKSEVIKDISEIVPGYKSIEFREFFSIPT